MVKKIIKKNNFHGPKIVILIFIVIVAIVPFYESRRFYQWEAQRFVKDNVFRHLIFSYSYAAEVIKSETGLSYFFARERRFWGKIKGNVNIEKIHLIVMEENQKRLAMVGGSGKPSFKILIIGDSLMGKEGGIGPMLKEEMLSCNENLLIYTHVKGSSGFTEPIANEITSIYKEAASEYNPNVVILMVGVVDASAFTDLIFRNPPPILEFNDTSEWKKEYSKRVSNLADILDKNNIKTFWIGLPIVRNENKIRQVGIKHLNSVFQKEAEKRENIYFIETWPLLTDNKGKYTDYLFIEYGYRQIRAPDGIHFTIHGKRIIVEEILDKIKKKIDLCP